MRKTSKPPIESFGPELMAALIEGSTKVFDFQLPYNDAVRFRRRIHQLRARMREEKHEKAMLVERARVSIIWGPDAGLPEIETRKINNAGRVPVDLNAPVKIRIKPYDSEFAAALNAAGVKVNVDVGPDVLGPSTSPDFLANYSTEKDPTDD